MLRAVASRRQLAEVLVDFWQNHFNVAAGSSQRTKYDISPYDRITIRPNVLGSFENLLLADAKSPAMGDYLDNRRNRVNAHQRELRPRGDGAAHRQRERPVHRGRRPRAGALLHRLEGELQQRRTASSSSPPARPGREDGDRRRDPAQRRHAGRPHDDRLPRPPSRARRSSSAASWSSASCPRRRRSGSSTRRRASSSAAAGTSARCSRPSSCRRSS